MKKTNTVFKVIFTLKSWNPKSIMCVYMVINSFKVSYYCKISKGIHVDYAG